MTNPKNKVQAPHHQLISLDAMETSIAEGRAIGTNDVIAHVLKKVDPYVVSPMAHAMSYLLRMGAKDDEKMEIEKAIWWLMDAHNRLSDLREEDREYSPWSNSGKRSDLRKAFEEAWIAYQVDAKTDNSNNFMEAWAAYEEDAQFDTTNAILESWSEFEADNDVTVLYPDTFTIGKGYNEVEIFLDNDRALPILKGNCVRVQNAKTGLSNKLYTSEEDGCIDGIAYFSLGQRFFLQVEKETDDLEPIIKNGQLNPERVSDGDRIVFHYVGPKPYKGRTPLDEPLTVFIDDCDRLSVKAPDLGKVSLGWKASDFDVKVVKKAV